MSQEVANFFVAEARRNMHKAASMTEEDADLVYNWAPQFTGVLESVDGGRGGEAGSRLGRRGFHEVGGPNPPSCCIPHTLSTLCPPAP